MTTRRFAGRMTTRRFAGRMTTRRFASRMTTRRFVGGTNERTMLHRTRHSSSQTLLNGLTIRGLIRGREWTAMSRTWFFEATVVVGL